MRVMTFASALIIIIIRRAKSNFGRDLKRKVRERAGARFIAFQNISVCTGQSPLSRSPLSFSASHPLCLLILQINPDPTLWCSASLIQGVLE